MNEEVQFVRGIESKINSYPITNGTILVTTDTRKIFVDYNNTRLDISDCIIIDTEVDRSNILVPIPYKIYYVIETNKLYTYILDWVLINPQADISVINDLTSNSTTDALSAAMGKQLNDIIGDISTILSTIVEVNE